MNNSSLISIITPIFNGEKYILETIQSVLSQTYQNWEMIIVDNKSTDNSMEIIKTICDNRIRIISLEYNSGGPARPRNIGLDNAKGEYIAFLDADDVWLPQKLEKQMSFLQQNNDVDICHTLSNVIDENSIGKGQVRKSKLQGILNFLLNKKDVLYYTNYININSVLMKIDKKLKFDEDKNLIALEDWKYWIDNQNIGKTIKCLNKVLLNYRVHDNSISQRKSDLSYRKSLYLLSVLILKNEMSLIQYCFSSFSQIIRIFIKNR